MFAHKKINFCLSCEHSNLTEFEFMVQRLLGNNKMKLTCAHQDHPEMIYSFRFIHEYTIPTIKQVEACKLYKERRKTK